MIVSLIVAQGPKREIGLNNKLLWHISEDLKNFKKITTGKAIVMGRKTFESIGKPLPDRKNIVLTRDKNFSYPGLDVITDPLMAFDLALEFNDSDESELVIIGGAEIGNVRSLRRKIVDSSWEANWSKVYFIRGNNRIRCRSKTERLWSEKRFFRKDNWRF